MIKVNADDTLRHCREGWSRENPNEQKGTKKEMTPDEKTADQMIQEELLKDAGMKQDDKNTESEAPNLDDLQA